MPVIKIRRGLDVPVSGALESTDPAPAPAPKRVAVLPQESWGIKAKMLVQEGDRVRLGEPLFHDRKGPGVLYTAPAAGTVLAVNRGHRRAVMSVVIRVDEEEESVEREPLDPASADRETLVEALAESGLWPAIRRRPFDKVARVDETPRSLFVTAMDTEPLAPRPQDLLQGREEEFRAGLAALRRLPEHGTWLCTSAGEDWSAWTVEGVEQQEFAGPHPAGNPGVHMNALDPVGLHRTAWHVGAQDVADVGHFLLNGRVPTKRRVAVVGPAARDRRIAETRRGAEMEVFRDHADDAEKCRFVSGSLLSGNTTQPGTETGFLGRFARQVAIVRDDPERELLGWSAPVGKRFSFTNVYLAKFLRRDRLKVDTDVNGSLRAIVPIGVYEEVMPMDILATQLIKALASDDLEGAEQLGALELAEEDLALCQYVCPSKIAITDMLRDMLTRIEKEG